MAVRPEGFYEGQTLTILEFYRQQRRIYKAGFVAQFQGKAVYTFDNSLRDSAKVDVVLVEDDNIHVDTVEAAFDDVFTLIRFPVQKPVAEQSPALFLVMRVEFEQFDVVGLYPTLEDAQGVGAEGTEWEATNTDTVFDGKPLLVSCGGKREKDFWGDGTHVNVDYHIYQIAVNEAQ